ncbi:hypothetical protein [Ruegeria arenilitoris]|uniref:hypothetical protein n=1 Tax=Ruegeria arenilitoris TaxID=1173585 RepID=UPI001480C708|nr:hypothetical protein [Ruegeria arenilitoris]
MSAISRVSTYVNRPPSDIPTDIPQLRKLLASLHPAACGVKPNTLSTTKSDLASALRAVGVLQDFEAKSELTPEWDTFLTTVQSTHQVWGLMRFAASRIVRCVSETSRQFNHGIARSLFAG